MTKTVASTKAAKPKIVSPTARTELKSSVAIVATTTPSTAGKPPSKQAQIVALLLRDVGATLNQMIAVTGWLPHTTRAALTGLKKRGYAISSDKVDDVRTYRAVAPEAAS